MSLTTKVVSLDAGGHGSVVIPPGYYVGAKGANVSNVTAADGGNLGTAFLTRANAIGVEGEVDVTGDPSGSVSLYFQYE
ncbi:MAG: hypothetical protein E6J20_17665 [Chloroflexi bacterium]|nr:MAG: hypothetical protein E6J20_17665 [Chloroflexota bacterium]